MSSPVTGLVEKYLPRTWAMNTLENAVQSGAVFAVFNVAASSPEFRVVTRELLDQGIQPVRVQRVQNVFMFGRYLLRHQQLLIRKPGGNIECQRYVCISEDMVDTLATYNVDTRRLSLPGEAFNLYSSPREAHNKWDHCDEPVMVVCRVSREDDVTTTDSEIYPEYVVKYDL